MTTILFDYDPILYAAACTGEVKSIKAVHRQSGDEYEFNNRTTFWGHWKTKSGGWLAEYNSGRKTPRLPEEFDIIDVQTPEPLENAMHTMKRMIEGYCETLGSKKYYGYTGTGKVFRHDLATVLEYKGNRNDSLRPIHLDSLKEYLLARHNCTLIRDIEVDDQCSIDSYGAYKKWKKSGQDSDILILAMAEKDYQQCTGHIWNTSNGGDVCSYDGFGWLKLDDKGNVRGRGRLWLLHQCLSNDTADNYAANSATTMKWGEKSSYNLLKDCKTDKEAFEAVVKGYKTLYPSPKVITGWRGDEIEVDWLYMMTENFNLAKLLRTQDEELTDVKSVLDRMGVAYD